MGKTKKCTKCKEVKPLKDFVKSKNNKDGYTGSCKVCSNKIKQAYIKSPVKRDRLNSKARVWSEKAITTILEGLEEWLTNTEDNNIFVGKYFLSIGTTTKVFAENCKSYPWLWEEYKRLREIQQFKLIESGLFRITDSGFTKFVMSNMHDWSEKSCNENELTLKGLDLNTLIGFEDNEE